ncbi:MAG: fatty-acyl-CoA synthase, partial [Mycobacterium sp.]|nr:fatty-acyl-CoA synthase [Mycobacterium sp.]
MPDPTAQPYLARRQNWTNQLTRHARMQPGATAFRFLGHTTTWGDLDGRVTALAGALSRRGVTFGDRVLILMLNRPEFIESILAINKLGAIAVPVNFRMTPPEIAFLVSDCQAGAVITESVLANVATAVRGIEPTLKTVIVSGGGDGVLDDGGVLDYDELLVEQGSPVPAVDIPDDSPALIMYTSGTTGRPKGAMLTHNNIAGQAMTNLFTMHPQATDVGFIGVPLFHIAGVGNTISPLQLGLPTVIYPLGAFDPGALL